MIEQIFGLGIIKAGAKVINHLSGGVINTPVEILEEITHCPGYTKMRIDDAQEQIRDFWDNYKEEVSTFIENVRENIGSGIEAAGDIITEGMENLGDFIGDLI